MDKATSKTLQFLTRVHQLDVVLFYWTMKRRHLELLTRLARRISHSADGFGYPVLALMMYWFDGDTGILFAQAMLLAFALERPLYRILKNGLKRNRPSAILPNYESAIIPSDQFSFPSGHTSGAFLVATLLSLFFPASAPFAYAWAALVATSRVTLGVHFPTDTLAGATMGSTIAWVSTLWLTQGGSI